MTTASQTAAPHTSAPQTLVRQMPGDALWSSADRWEQISPDPFSGPDWFHIWRTYFSRTGRWLPSAIFRGRELAAVAPWVERHETRIGVRLRQISLATCVYSPVTQIVCDGPCELPSAFEALMDDVMQRDWDVIRLKEVPEECGQAEAFRQCFRRRGIPFLEKPSEPNWFQQIAGSVDDYFAARSGKMLRNMRARQRKLSQKGSISMRIVTEEKDVERAMDLYYTVYGASWKKTEGVPAFHRDLAHVAAQRGWLRLALCLADDEPIAAQLWLVRKRIGYSVKVCHDERLRQYGPGVILTAFLIRHLIEQDGVREIDFLKGDEDYKANWADQRRVRRQFVAFNPSTLRGRMGKFVTHRIRPLLGRDQEKAT